MSDKSGIEWCDATWNPIVGCKRVSPGCDHCYAIRDGARLQHLPAYEDTISGADWTGLVRCLAERLGQPLAWKRPRRIFVNSMGDLFHPDVPEAFIEQVFVVMSRTVRPTGIRETGAGAGGSPPRRRSQRLPRRAWPDGLHTAPGRRQVDTRSGDSLHRSAAERRARQGRPCRCQNTRAVCRRAGTAPHAGRAARRRAQAPRLDCEQAVEPEMTAGP